jgi:carboxyl-terminal processing protease
MEGPVSTSPRPAVGRLLPFVFLGLIWLSAAFLGGYILGQTEALVGNRRVGEVVLQAGSAVGLQPPVARRAAESVLDSAEQDRFRVFWEAWSVLERDYYNRAALDSQVLTHGAVKGLVESVGDPHTAFSTPREKEQQDASLRGTFDGIGVQVDFRDGRLRVVAPIEGSPAERAGVLPGDVVARVDDRDVRGMDLNAIVQLIRGPRGTFVSLTVIREGSPEPLQFSIERAEIKVETVRGRILDNGLGYLRITSFTSNSGPETTAAVKRLMESQPSGLVLDLRSNPGGYLHSAVDIASQFLSDGVILYQQSSDGHRQEYRAKAGGSATTVPVAVLIDRGSASASEIVAAALRDNGRATLVGEQSYGKGSVQSVHTLSDSSGLRVTSAVWLTPTGQPLEQQGLLPDLAVARPPQPGDDDPQLDAAVRHLLGTAAAVGG